MIGALCLAMSGAFFFAAFCAWRVSKLYGEVAHLCRTLSLVFYKVDEARRLLRHQPLVDEVPALARARHALDVAERVGRERLEDAGG